MQPFSPHTKFFSSLKQVEKRLKSEHNPPTTTPQLHDSSTQPSPSDQLSAPLYLYSSLNQPTINTEEDSNPPQEFLSNSTPPPSKAVVDDQEEEEESDDKDDIQHVIELLGLLDMDKEEGKSGVKDGCGGESFYSKIVGVKGPKNDKELERLDGWIKYFMSGNDGVKEPLRLVHLLIGKAVVANEEDENSGFGAMEFPSTVEEFLDHDPPTTTEP